NRFEQNLFSFNVLEIVKRQLGEEFFLDQGAVSNSEQIELLKPKITNDRGNVYGWGSGSDGNKMSFAVWNVRWLNWSGTRSTTASTVTNINLPINNANEYIDSDGICRFIAYSNASDGTTASSLNIDYANYQFTIELSMNE
ncbi:phage baseplate upper protein, partial [Enterococcus avium]|nr:phage baseplate upper protein [Enterococcus avium]